MRGMDYGQELNWKMLVASTLGVKEDDIIELFGVARNCSPPCYGTDPVLKVELFLPVKRINDHIEASLKERTS